MILKEILTQRLQLTLCAWIVVMDENGCDRVEVERD